MFRLLLSYAGLVFRWQWPFITACVVFNAVAAIAHGVLPKLLG